MLWPTDAERTRPYLNTINKKRRKAEDLLLTPTLISFHEAAIRVQPTYRTLALRLLIR